MFVILSLGTFFDLIIHFVTSFINVEEKFFDYFKGK